MRAYVYVMSLMLAVAAPAMAQSNEGPQSPNIPSVATTTPAQTTAVPAQVGAPIADEEPNMRIAAGSGGKVSASAITEAPLMSDYVLGDAAAPVILIEYASLTCPHCAHFSNVVLPDLEKNYIKTGKLRYILRQFPLNEPALKGAMLLDCVGSQDRKRYYTFARVLFDAQSKWAFDTNYMSGLETIATVGGLTKDQFYNCVNNTDRETKILKMKKDANDALKIPHTPYIIIGGEIYNGERSYPAVSKFIDAKLIEAKDRSWVPKW